MCKLKNNKVRVRSKLIYRLLHPRHTVLVTCMSRSGRANIITLAWTMPASIRPPMVAIGIAPKRLSHKVIDETGEFVVNVPTIRLAKKALFCGRTSGINVDKFKETKLTALSAMKVKPPLIKECIAHLECRVTKKITAGDHTLFIGEVLAAHVNKRIFKETFNVKRAKPLIHMGGDSFTTISSKVVTPRPPLKTAK